MKSTNTFQINGARINHFVILLFIFPLIFSCSENDFVNVTPEDRLDKTTFFSTAQEVVLGVNGVYASQRSIVGNFFVFVIQEVRSDNVAHSQSDNPERRSIDIFQEGPGNLFVLRAWRIMYNTINLANAVIERGPDASGDENLINRAIGEAKFLRAFTYFEMVNLWGEVPLRLSEATDFDDATVLRSPVSEVYDQIVQDLNDAISVLPNSYDGSSNYEKGRATRYAALTLLGKVELQRGNNEAAEAALRQVLDQFSLLPNFANIYAAGNDNTAESIFEVSFNPANQTGLGLPGRFIPQSEADRLGIASGAAPLQVFPTQNLIDVFETGDERRAATFTVTSAEGKPYISKFMDLSASAQGHDINLVVLRYADVLLMLAEAIGESPESYGYINEVRSRAGLGSIDKSTSGTFTEKLMYERRVEFAFEQHRWFDLLRLSDQEVLDIMTAQLNQQLSTSVSLTEDDLLFPIPQSEIDVSDGVVTQNPGY